MQVQYGIVGVNPNVTVTLYNTPEEFLFASTNDHGEKLNEKTTESRLRSFNQKRLEFQGAKVVKIFPVKKGFN